VALEGQHGVIAHHSATLSVIWMSFFPPASDVNLDAREAASREFSSNSFTTEAGRSNTSPAAILLAQPRKGREFSHEFSDECSPAVVVSQMRPAIG